MSNYNWHDYFFNIIKVVKSKSKDPSTQFGCVIVGPDNEIRSTGYNSFPRGLNDNVAERMVRPEKYFWFEHSERNAIYNAARVGTPTNDCRLYVDGIPCVDCARAIVQSGIKKVIYNATEWNKYVQGMKEKNINNTWAEHIEKTLTMFQECGVEVEAYKKEIGND